MNNNLKESDMKVPIHVNMVGQYKKEYVWETVPQYDGVTPLYLGKFLYYDGDEAIFEKDNIKKKEARQYKELNLEEEDALSINERDNAKHVVANISIQTFYIHTYI